MKNMFLFAVTVLGYFGVWRYLGGMPESESEYVFRLGMLALLCAPFNINGNVWTVLGNATSPRSVYSIFSFYQYAKKNAGMIFSFLSYQKARGGDAIVLLGVSCCQKANDAAGVFIGFSFYQDSGRESCVFCGVSCYQQTLGHALTCAGFSVYQEGYYSVETKFGLALYQVVENDKGKRTRSIALFSELHIEDEKDESAPRHCGGGTYN